MNSDKTMKNISMVNEDSKATHHSLHLAIGSIRDMDAKVAKNYKALDNDMQVLIGRMQKLDSMEEELKKLEK